MHLVRKYTILRLFAWSFEPRKGPTAVCMTEAIPSFLSYFKTLMAGIDPTSCSIVSIGSVER